MDKFDVIENLTEDEIRELYDSSSSEFTAWYHEYLYVECLSTTYKGRCTPCGWWEPETRVGNSSYSSSLSGTYSVGWQCCNGGTARMFYVETIESYSYCDIGIKM